MTDKSDLIASVSVSLLTENEAKQKWCPLARTENSRDVPAVSVNRFGNGLDMDCYCLASACMAWRKVDQIGIGPNGEKRARDHDGRTRWHDRGYCGAFGRPA